MYKNKFGELLKKYAEESGIESGSELARMAGLSPATVTRIYTGKQKATPETLKALAPHVGKTYEHLMHQAGYLYHNPIPPNNITYVCEDPGTKQLAEKIDKLNNNDRKAIETLVNTLLKSGDNK